MAIQVIVREQATLSAFSNHVGEAIVKDLRDRPASTRDDRNGTGGHGALFAPEARNAGGESAGKTA
jgi:hypothetical protein